MVYFFIPESCMLLPYVEFSSYKYILEIALIIQNSYLNPGNKKFVNLFTHAIFSEGHKMTVQLKVVLIIGSAY